MFIWHIGQTVTIRSAPRRVGRVEQAADHARGPCRGLICGHVAAAAVGPQRVVDDLGAQRGRAAGRTRAGCSCVAPALVEVRPRDQAAQVRRDAQAGAAAASRALATASRPTSWTMTSSRWRTLTAPGV